MSKKSRRARAKSQTTVRRPQKTGIQQVEPVKKKAVSDTAVTQPGISAIASTQQNRYYYIVPELRRIAIIAGALIVILIILTFVLG